MYKVKDIALADFGRKEINIAEKDTQDLGYVNREEDPFGLEIDFVAGSKQLSQIVDRAIKVHGFTMAAEVLDNIKSMGYKYSTRASLSISVADMIIPDEKYEIVKAAEKQVDEIFAHFRMGELLCCCLYEFLVTCCVTNTLVDSNLDELRALHYS